jgi:hypothetical protein
VTARFGRARAVAPFLERHAALFIGALALVIRLVQNLVFHPPMSRVYSDMSGYVGRARAMLDNPGAKDPTATFFPYGTHFLIYGVDRVFGRDNAPAIGATFAVLGTIAVLYSYFAAREVFKERPRIAFAIGIILATYVPWIRQGGFVLSEIPLACAIAATSYYLLRLADRGRARDAMLLGVSFAIGATFRPQILASAVFLLPVALIYRRGLRARWWTAGVVALPIALVVAGSAWRTHYHTDRYGFIATNGAFNFALGRCHPISMTAKGHLYRATYGPPPFDALDEYEQRHGMKPILSLDPALGRKISFDGEQWDGDAALDLAKKCMEKTGLLGQVKYAVSHVMLLWLYNGPWPSSAGVPTAIFAGINAVAFAPAMFLGWVTAIRRKNAGILLLSTHIAGLLTTAVLFFGEARLRLPYDGVILTMAAYGYEAAFPVVRGRIKRFRERRAARRALRLSRSA